VAARRLIAVATDAFGGPESIAALGDEVKGGGEVKLVFPATEINPLHHTLGDIDEPRARARRRMEEALAASDAAGVAIADAEVGDPDPVRAAQDALLVSSADEVLFFSHTDDEKSWYESDLWRRAEDELEPALRLIVVSGTRTADHVLGTTTAPAGHTEIDREAEEGEGSYIPGVGRSDAYAMSFAIVGTIITIVLAAVAASGGTPTGWRAVAIGAAIVTALTNMVFVVSMLLMDSVRYRGGFARAFRVGSTVITPIAIIVNLLIVALS
jgi:hypothetical protein